MEKEHRRISHDTQVSIDNSTWWKSALHVRCSRKRFTVSFSFFLCDDIKFTMREWMLAHILPQHWFKRLESSEVWKFLADKRKKRWQTGPSKMINNFRARQFHVRWNSIEKWNNDKFRNFIYIKLIIKTIKLFFLRFSLSLFIRPRKWENLNLQFSYDLTIPRHLRQEGASKEAMRSFASCFRSYLLCWRVRSPPWLSSWGYAEQREKSLDLETFEILLNNKRIFNFLRSLPSASRRVSMVGVRGSRMNKFKLSTNGLAEVRGGRRREVLSNSRY